MRRVLLCLCLIAAVLPFYSAPAQATHSTGPGCSDTSRKVQGYIDVAQGTPDAATLHYQVFLPNPTLFGEGPYPTVMDYSGYQPGITIYDGLHRHFLCEGYAVAGVNIRGTGCSSGRFDYFEPRQAEDGREAIEWLTTPPPAGYTERGDMTDPAHAWWTNGRLAMVGKSYPGITQLFVAGQPLDALNPDAKPDVPDGLVAIVPGHVFGDLYRDVPYPGGIMNVTFAGGWSAGRIYEPFTAPLADHQAIQKGDTQCVVNTAQHVQNPPFNPFVRALVNHYDGDLFRERSPWYWADNIDVPTMLVESWQDEQVGSRATALTERFSPDLEWRMLATNGDHWEYYGSHVLPFIDEFLRFYLAQKVPERWATGTRQVTVFQPKHSNPNAAAKDESKGKGEYVTTEETVTYSYEEALANYEASNPVQINWETGGGSGPAIPNAYPEPGGGNAEFRDRRPTWIQTYGQWPPRHDVWRLNLTPGGGLVEEAAPPGSVSYNYTPGRGTQQRGGYKLTGQAPTVDGHHPATWNEYPAEGTFAMFETPALPADRLIAGPASLDLTVSSTAADTDFQVTVTEVRPNGAEVFVQQGWLRASHRELDERLSTPIRPYHTHEAPGPGNADEVALVPGMQEQVRIEIFPFAHPFRAGSKLRVYVEAPHVKPDLWGFALLPTPAVNTIYTGPGLSSLALPLVLDDAGHPATAPVPALECDPARNTTWLNNQPCRRALGS